MYIFVYMIIKKVNKPIHFKVFFLAESARKLYDELNASENFDLILQQNWSYGRAATKQNTINSEIEAKKENNNKIKMT